MQLAEEYPTKAEVRAAFTKYGSWSEICARGLGERGDAARRLRAEDERYEEEMEQVEAFNKAPVNESLKWLGVALKQASERLVEQQNLSRVSVTYAGYHVDVRDMRAMLAPLLERYEKTQARWVGSLGAEYDPGLLKLVPRSLWPPTIQDVA